MNNIITDNRSKEAVMKILSKYKNLIALPFIVTILAAPIANAHLMVAQHGTLNFLDNSVYMVLSLPSSAFGDADEDNDGLLSLTEFSTHRLSLIETVTEHVSLLSNKTDKLPIDGLMISPVTPHDDPKAPAAQIIVMGRYVLDDADSKLSFLVNLFGTNDLDQSIEITANRKSSNHKQVFELTPKLNEVKLNFN
ncbi:hypothetical protein N9850_11770 [Granulosicoccus sp.]|nr:hypothetical protein [Granulosicoccus sp.]MDB4224445.1 hypothetical protein [Granulosicoccus sp.]